MKLSGFIPGNICKSVILTIQPALLTTQFPDTANTLRKLQDTDPVYTDEVN